MKEDVMWHHFTFSLLKSHPVSSTLKKVVAVWRACGCVVRWMPEQGVNVFRFTFCTFICKRMNNYIGLLVTLSLPILCPAHLHRCRECLLEPRLPLKHSWHFYLMSYLLHVITVLYTHIPLLLRKQKKMCSAWMSCEYLWVDEVKINAYLQREKNATVSLSQCFCLLNKFINEVRFFQLQKPKLCTCLLTDLCYRACTVL